MEVVLDAHPDGVLVLDRTGVVQYANPACEELFDTPLASIVGRQFSARLPDQESVDLRTRSGRMLELRAVPASWHGDPATLVCVRDVTEHRALQEHARASQSPDGTEALLHDLGTALNTVQVAVDSLEERVDSARLGRVEDLLTEHAHSLEPVLSDHPALQEFPDRLASISEALRQDRERLRQETERLRRSLTEIRRLVDHASDGSAASHQVPLSRIVDRALTVEEAALHQAGVEVEIALSTAGNLVFDQRILLPVVLNLIANARQAVQGVDRQHPAIKVSARKRWPETVRIVVADNGRGIRHEHLPRLFDHGFTTRPDGRGVGLYACAAAARELGGRLTARSEGRGRGAAFVLDLPAPQLAGQHTPPPAARRRREAPMTAK